ncbi:DUF4446 family protein [Streptosporangium roseum]|uniref:DUF4446 family protein n=1 Tax=Streptosporangium roseum TaxID=2001 RepID=UPI003331C092
MFVTVGIVVGVVAGVAGVVIGALALWQARGAVGDRSRTQVVEGAGSPGDLRAIRDVAVFRYDAPEEMTGQLSFSVALMNGLGDGIVLTSINGHSEARTYVRPLRGGKGRQPLSPEEEHAVRAARLGLGPEAEPHFGRE